MIKKLLENRTISSFGVSVGTGLMLESIIDTPTTERIDNERIIPNKINYQNYKGLIFNFYTLLRNMVNSFETPIKYETKHVPILFKEVIDEFNIIRDIFSVYTNDEHYVKLFIPSYKKAIEIFNINKKYEGLLYIEKNKTLEKDFNKYFLDINKTNTIYNKSYHFPNEYKINDYLICTHMAIDLLGSNKFHLLESHTGKLKKQVEFNSKYAKFGNNDMSILPFNDILLFLLGDNQLIKGVDVKYKKIIYDTAVIRNWTPATTRQKVIHDLNKASAGIDMFIKSFKGY